MDDQLFELQSSFRNESALKYCTSMGGNLTGSGCKTPEYAPNVFFLSCILFAATYTISVALKEFKNSPFFPTKIRQVVSDFSVVIAIASMTLADNWIRINTPKLFVPSEFKVFPFWILFSTKWILYSLPVMTEAGWCPGSTRRIPCGWFHWQCFPQCSPPFWSLWINRLRPSLLTGKSINSK